MIENTIGISSDMMNSDDRDEYGDDVFVHGMTSSAMAGYMRGTAPGLHGRAACNLLATRRV